LNKIDLLISDISSESIEFPLKNKFVSHHYFSLLSFFFFCFV